MSDAKANVGSLEALQQFHIFLNQFSEETQSVFDSVRCEIKRYQQLVDFDIPAKIKRNALKWEDRLREAKLEMNPGQTSSRKLLAQQKIREATNKVRQYRDEMEKIKNWQKKLPVLLPTEFSTLVKAKTFLTNDLNKATTLLHDYIRTLDEYREQGQ
ncbi:MAG: hypothetical protein NE334_18320 [Lentisphaeraceae bacterium]|nr:hypothetical protein [Lentisphaeraceae bacterium]